MTQVKIIDLQRILAPDDASERRLGPLPAKAQTPEYRAALDSVTLAYDCVADDCGRALVTAPAFDALWPLFARSLRVDGRAPRRLRRVRHGRVEHVIFKASQGATLQFEMGGAPVPMRLRPSEAHSFRGLNALMTVSRNNDLAWIADWAAYNVSAYGANGVLLFDNGSDAYAPGQIAETLAAVDGLQQVTVVTAPFPWGGQLHLGGRKIQLKYLQGCLLNLARLDFLSQARAVLNTDIDELVVGPKGGSIFDATMRCRWGVTQIGGDWIYPERAQDIPGPHRVNTWRGVQCQPCQPKWCARPGGPLSRLFGWQVHDVGRSLGRRISADDRFRLLHCASVTTGWKRASHRFAGPERAQDPALATLMDRHFPASPEA